MRKIITRKTPRRLTAALVLAAGAALLTPAAAPASAATAAAPCLDVTGVPPTGPALSKVAVLTACSAWAVTNSLTIDHWDGANWVPQQAAGPSGGTRPNLGSVTASSAASVWAAGDYFSSTGQFTTLIEHWNGTAWSVSPTPAIPSGESGDLADLSASSASDAWAVGSVISEQGPPSTQTGLAEHWDGRSWTQVPANSPAGGSSASGVADISPANAWMVGFTGGDSLSGPAWIAHWDGTSWAPAPVPGMPARSELHSVRALSASNVWAVGTVYSSTPRVQAPLIVHYDGTSWTVMSGIPNPDNSSEVLGVAVTSTGAMAVGHFFDASGQTHPLVLLWNGTTWAQLPAPSPGFSGLLAGVGGTSNNYWAVGSYASDDSTTNPLALHCC